MILVVAYEYAYVLTGAANHDQVYTVAGKVINREIHGWGSIN
jgi:hypothetical protein